MDPERRALDRLEQAIRRLDAKQTPMIPRDMDISFTGQLASMYQRYTTIRATDIIMSLSNNVAFALAMRDFVQGRTLSEPQIHEVFQKIWDGLDHNAVMYFRDKLYRSLQNDLRMRWDVAGGRLA